MIMEWIMAIPGDDIKAYCRYCKLEMHMHHSDLVSHAVTEKNAYPAWVEKRFFYT